MAKRLQQDSGEGRVTAKSRPMMSLIATAPSALSSSASESPAKRSYESQSPLSAQAKMYDRTVKPVVCRDTSHEQRHHHRFVESTHSASYSEWDADKAWSSQEWKSDELMDDRIGETRDCPHFPCYEPIVQRSTQKQRTWKTVDTLCSRFGNG